MVRSGVVKLILLRVAAVDLPAGWMADAMCVPSAYCRGGRRSASDRSAAICDGCGRRCLNAGMRQLAQKVWIAYLFFPVKSHMSCLFFFFLIYVMSPPLLYFDTSASSKQQGPIAAQCSILGPDRSRVDFSCAAHLTRSVYISH